MVTHDVWGFEQVNGAPRPNTAGKAPRASTTDFDNNEAMISDSMSEDSKNAVQGDQPNMYLHGQSQIDNRNNACSSHWWARGQKKKATRVCISLHTVLTSS